MISAWVLILGSLFMAFIFLVIFILQVNKMEDGEKTYIHPGYYLIPIFSCLGIIVIIILLIDYLPYKFDKEIPVKFDGKVYYAIDTDTNEILNPQEFTKEKINESMKVYKYFRDNKLWFIQYGFDTVSSPAIRYETR